MVHAARSNMNTQTGMAAPAKFGVRACFGTDVMSLDVLSEAQVAALRSRDAGQPIDLLRLLTNGHRLASQVFGVTIGPLREGAVADLIVIDYQAPSPLTADTLASHLLHGMTAQHVESVMIDGLWRLWKRKPLAVDPAEVARASRESVAALWSRLAS
jgi:cytosine/adenosine deaminase-related metal-dependent hydrolase